MDLTSKSYAHDLAQLSQAVARMGGLAESLVGDSLHAVARRDSELAQTVIARDAKIDQCQREIEREVVRIIALRQPLARDLRQTIAALKLATDLERIGDLARNIARRALSLNQSEPLVIMRGVERMGRLVTAQLKQVLDAFASDEAAGAMEVWQQDETVDELYNSLFRELLTYMIEDPRLIGPCAHLLFVAKNLERVGDHCTNMAEALHYVITGEDLPAQRPRSSSETGPETGLDYRTNNGNGQSLPGDAPGV